MALLLRLVGPLWGRGKEPQVCQGAGAEFSGLVLSLEDGRRVFLKVSQATGTAHGIAQWREHQDVTQTRRRMSIRQKVVGWKEKQQELSWGAGGGGATNGGMLLCLHSEGRGQGW